MVKSIKRILFATVLGLSMLVSAPGDLDLTFGDGGKVTTYFSEGHDYGSSVAMQDDGKIVVVGFASDDSALARYNSDGGLDLTFGDGGKVTTDVGWARSVAIQDDDKIVVVGAALVRYNTDGTLDTTFGIGGKVMTGGGRCVTIQDDGKIVVAGSTSDDFALARYNSDGVLDSTFGIGGKVTTDFDGDTDYGHSVSIQDDGKIVVAGQTMTSSGYNFALARYKANGDLDQTFGDEGKTITDFSGDRDMGYSVAIQDDGKIVVAGQTANFDSGMIEGDSQFALARYNTNGMLDATFGIDGMVTTDFSKKYNKSLSVVIQDNGKIVVAGYSGTYSYWILGSNFALARYEANGDLDTTFGTDGKVITDFDGSNDFGISVTIQDNGKIVVTGTTDTMPPILGGHGTFGLARYKGDPTQRVNIDIIPNKSPNIIKYKINKGECLGAKVKVDMLSTSDFDVTLIDPSSVMLGDPKLDGKSNPIKSKIQDVNHDGYDDIQFTFSICDLVNEEALNADTTKLILTGETPDGIIVTGKDMVEVEQK